MTDKAAVADKANTQERLFDRYDRAGLETGVRLQGEFFLRMVSEFDELDSEWTEGWIKWIYGDLYRRDILEDKTRVLIVIGECCVLGELSQLPNHIRSALRVGASAREVLEVILQSAIYAGMPKMIQAMRTYRALMRDLGMLELADPAFRGDARD
jgi:4-carboxymuconolactone decarboxylase